MSLFLRQVWRQADASDFQPSRPFHAGEGEQADLWASQGHRNVHLRAGRVNFPGVAIQAGGQVHCHDDYGPTGVAGCVVELGNHVSNDAGQGAGAARAEYGVHHQLRPGQ